MKEIPIYFDSVTVSSPIEKISESYPNLGRLKVRVFTKYGNRNGSYITEKVADQLIRSATKGTTPVVGFFDPETQSWASHSGPTLANAYGYVEDFLGWEPFEDTDGVVRDYAVFSIILFTNYFEEANKVFGQNQSMELDPESITGAWAMIDGEEYFVYTSANMLGFCIIGEHEPCFSVSSFFSKQDDAYKSQQEKFSSLLFDLKAQVEEAEKTIEGGEQPMNEFENQDVVEQVENPQVEEAPETFEEVVEIADEAEATTETEVEVENEFDSNEAEVATEVEEESEETNEPSEFEVLQNQFNELQESYNTLKNEFDNAQARINELEQFQSDANTQIETLRSENEQLHNSLQSYEAQAMAAEENRKFGLVKKYEKVMHEEEINPIKEMIKDFSYDELESKLAITFANKQIAGSEETIKKVPLPEPEESQFALLMKKYRKN